MKYPLEVSELAALKGGEHAPIREHEFHVGMIYLKRCLREVTVGF